MTRESEMEPALFVWEKGWTGRVSPKLILGDQTAPISGGDIRVSQHALTGKFLALANSDEPNRLKRLAAAFPAPIPA